MLQKALIGMRVRYKRESVRVHESMRVDRSAYKQFKWLGIINFMHVVQTWLFSNEIY